MKSSTLVASLLVAPPPFLTTTAQPPHATHHSRRRSKWDGYEDEETWRELTGGEGDYVKPDVPLMAVEVDEMPVGARVEWEVVAMSKKAMCLG